jgi:16S rRNA (guanine966-N2)-methyltransferase
MRVVSGKLKGRRFSPPSSFKARPTTDQARESLFNILNNLIDIRDQVVLDLFGGTGAISYEFASRGCCSVTSIEKNYTHFKFIQKTASDFNLTPRLKVIKADVFKFISRKQGKFSLIFADPPFNLPQIPELPSLILNSGMLAPQGLFILEHGPNYNFNNEPFFWQMRRYGKVNFSFFLNSPEAGKAKDCLQNG